MRKANDLSNNKLSSIRSARTNLLRERSAELAKHEMVCQRSPEASSEDILQDRRKNGELRWVTRQWKAVPPYCGQTTQRTPAELSAAVLNSERIHHVITTISNDSGRPVKDVKREASNIIAEMGHTFTMNAVRGWGVVLSKAAKALFDGIYVNTDGINRLREVTGKHPVIFMPSHRSYADFLLLSFVCYHYNLPIPAVAAGQDFMSMKFVGKLMRNAGAFFIRRSFNSRSDPLYWAIFSEYIQAHLTNADQPLEFFVEGTRSRTGKSLQPKFGLLSVALEPYFKSQVSDIYLVPVSIGYDRTLEEVLYAYEMLGVPKPKESTSGLLKARGIFDQLYGCIHVNVGTPISVRKFSEGLVDRGLYSFGPRHLYPITQQEKTVCERLAYRVLAEQQKGLVLASFTATAAILLDYAQRGTTDLLLKTLINETIWLIRVLRTLGAKISWDDTASPDSLVRESLLIHQNIVHHKLDLEAVLANAQIIQIHCSDPTSSLQSSSLDGDTVVKRASPLANETLEIAVSHMVLTYYTNQILHHVIKNSLLAIVMMSLRRKPGSDWSFQKDDLFGRFASLQSVLKHEFIFEPEMTTQYFEKSVARFTELEVFDLQASQADSVTVTSGNPQTRKIVELLARLVEPFLFGYRIVCQALLDASCTDQQSTSTTVMALGDIVAGSQLLAEKLLSDGHIPYYQTLSKDILANGVYASASAGGLLQQQPSNGKVLYSIKPMEVSLFAREIEQYIQWPTYEQMQDHGAPTSNILPRAKL